MKIIFLFVLLFQFNLTSIKAATLADDPYARSVCGVAVLPFYRAKGVIRGGDALCFRSEQLNENNRKFWGDFCNYQQAKGGYWYHHLRLGNRALEEILKIWDSKPSDSNLLVHITFCSRLNIADENVRNMLTFERIEMVLGVFSAKKGSGGHCFSDCPLSTHVDITGDVAFYDYKKATHKNIAVLMHGFSAYASTQRDPSLQYMFTRPSVHMTRILQQYFSQTDKGRLYIPGVTSEARNMGVDDVSSVPITNAHATIWYLHSMNPLNGKRVSHDNYVMFNRPSWCSHWNILSDLRGPAHTVLDDHGLSLEEEELKEKLEKTEVGLYEKMRNVRAQTGAEPMIAIALVDLCKVWQGRKTP